jgi:hypothetical protein
LKSFADLERKKSPSTNEGSSKFSLETSESEADERYLYFQSREYKLRCLELIEERKTGWYVSYWASTRTTTMLNFLHDLLLSYRIATITSPMLPDSILAFSHLVSIFEIRRSKRMHV